MSLSAIDSVGNGSGGVVVLTGGSSGIGYALARVFAAGGAELLLVARNRERLADAARALRDEFGVTVWSLPLDVSRPDAADVILRFLSDNGLVVGTLVNNAAVWVDGPVAAAPASSLDAAFATNSAGPVRLSHALLPGMLARGRGQILNIGSIAGETAIAGMGLYAASKAFLRAYTLVLREELRPRGITVTLLVPGLVSNDFTTREGHRMSLVRRLLGMDCDAVARVGYAGLQAGRAVVVPGLVNRIIYFGRRLLPARLETLVLRTVLGLARGRATVMGGADRARVRSGLLPTGKSA